MQLMARALGGHVAGSDKREYGRTEVQFSDDNSLLPSYITHFKFHVWMSHGDKVDQAPPGFTVTATSSVSAINPTSRAMNRTL